jgi:transcriptional regulator
MYVPAPFAELRVDELHRTIADYPLGMLVTPATDGFDANHIPFELDATRGEHGVLFAHVARANPVWRDTPPGSNVLVVFRGAEAYVSPNWYPSKAETEREVPTWNYIVVHAHGRLVIRDDEGYVRTVVARLTKRHESSQVVPWKMSDADPAAIGTMLKAIVGIEVEITRLTGKSKLGQNKAEHDRLGAAAALTAHGKTAIADAMVAAVPAAESEQ